MEKQGLFIERSWAVNSGMLPMPLYPNNADNRFKMLSGGWNDFCIDLSGELGEVSTYNSRSWSSGSKHYINILSDEVIVLDWSNIDNASPTRIPVENVAARFDKFIQIINSRSLRSDKDVVSFIMNIFNRIRTYMQDKNSALESLNILFKLLISINEESSEINCAEWGIADVRLPVDFYKFTAELRRGAIEGIKPDLDLILCHCAGPLFEIAHRNVRMFDPQLDLFTVASSNVKYNQADRYSSLHYTPQYVVRSVVENALRSAKISERSSLTIFDPACGSGIFLIEALSQLKKEAFRGTITLKAWDVSDVALQTTKFVLEYYNRTQWEGKVKIIIRKVEDSLIEDWGSDNDIILMNPPFVSFELLKEPKRKDSVMEVMQRFGGIRKPNQAAAFFVKSIDSLSSNGVIGTILPSSLLYANQYREMRAKIQEVINLSIVGRLGNYVFENALADTSIVCGIKKVFSDSPYLIWCKNEPRVTERALIELRKIQLSGIQSVKNEQYNIYIPDRFPVIRDSWNVLSHDDAIFYTNIERAISLKYLTRLGDVFTVRQGAITGRKGLFNITIEEYNSLPENERRYYRPLLTSGDIRNGVVSSSCFVWFPYDIHGLAITSEESLKELKWSWEYLQNSKSILEKRVSAPAWWAWTSPRQWQLEKAQRLYSQRFGDASMFGIGERDDYVIEDGNTFTPKKEGYSLDELYFYLAFFSSSVFNRLLAIYSKHIMKGYDMGNEQIKNIPIVQFKRPSSSNLLDLEKEAQACLISIGKDLSRGCPISQKEIGKIISSYYPIYG